jgi:hypothetical protein
LETHPNVVGWLIVTMKNRAMTAQRELDKQARIVDELSRIAQFPDTMDISLMELIETLSPADQEILTLYYVKNSKLRKITNLFLEANMAEEQERYKGQYTIFTNLDHLTAVWAQGFCEIVIQGDLTYEQLTQMLDSINE